MITWQAYHFWAYEPLETLVRKGAQLYTAKHGEAPNLCQVHKSLLAEEIIIDGIRVIPDSGCLRHDYLFARVEPMAIQVSLF